ncbi:MAG: hypothetical protein JY451_14025 [Erythrobacter sp.]|nr:MAG: hypothetical protein JY451_14025 [Erythrobacter sp.]
MSDTLIHLEADRLMRDAAKRLVQADIRNIRGDVNEQGVGSRMALRLREGAEGVGDDIAAYTRENQAQVGTVLVMGAAVLFGWLFRDSLGDAIEKVWQDITLTPEPTLSERIAAKARSFTD